MILIYQNMSKIFWIGCCLWNILNNEICNHAIKTITKGIIQDSVPCDAGIPLSVGFWDSECLDHALCYHWDLDKLLTLCTFGSLCIMRGNSSAHLINSCKFLVRSYCNAQCEMSGIKCLKYISCYYYKAIDFSYKL